jgi:hypothetical protein
MKTQKVATRKNVNPRHVPWMDHTINPQVQLANAELNGQVKIFFFFLKPKTVPNQQKIIYFLDINIFSPGGIHHARPF